ncbi:jg3646 [Pararge aegeria aegeria]|uniref:Jg3646 protein n=1 Tax=Pararge aegeria aegeria TaxID=348720 RepID=A0A8S4RFY0_9NEOP|nr:jg3646 [Pararge aegeria aegeria]
MLDHAEIRTRPPKVKSSSYPMRYHRFLCNYINENKRYFMLSGHERNTFNMVPLSGIDFKPHEPVIRTVTTPIRPDHSVDA